MRTPVPALVATLLAATALTGCNPATDNRTSAVLERQLDDLATSGLGIEGLRGPAPGFEDPQQPTGLELRRLALHTNYNALIDMAAASGFGVHHGPLETIPGTEVLAWRYLDGQQYPHGVALQIPADFKPDTACLVIAPASGSRGIYGAAGVVGDWGLQKGCAVVYTDKGAGTGFYDADNGQGPGVAGQLTDQPTGFKPASAASIAKHRVAVKHAHSSDNPEMHWGEHVLDAGRFALDQLRDRFAGMGEVRVIAAGISNGGAAALRAAARDRDGLLDAVVVGEPNVYPPARADVSVRTPEARFSPTDARPLYDYATVMGLYQPCAILAPAYEKAPFAMAALAKRPVLEAHCKLLERAGLLQGDAGATPPEQADQVIKGLKLTAGARRLGAANVVLGLWPAIAATYAQAYNRKPAGESVCGVGFARVDGAGKARATTRAERARWFATSSGIVPSAGLVLVDADNRVLAQPKQLADKAWCWRQLWQQSGGTLRESIAAIRAGVPARDIPIIIIHGRADALIPVNHSARPYAAAAYAAGLNKLRYYEVENAQHFDALVAAPGMRQRLVAMHPYTVAAMNMVWRHLDTGMALAPSQVIRTDPGAEPTPAAIAAEPGTERIEFRDAVLRIP